MIRQRDDLVSAGEHCFMSSRSKTLSGRVRKVSGKLNDIQAGYCLAMLHRPDVLCSDEDGSQWVLSAAGRPFRDQETVLPNVTVLLQLTTLVTMASCSTGSVSLPNPALLNMTRANNGRQQRVSASKGRTMTQSSIELISN